ncbi:MAG: hypothetical protein KOO63_16885 [Bacteroidales bacterium]|nr:hypothetical protein [Candidatus Latescibacterota bacterium]
MNDICQRADENSREINLGQEGAEMESLWDKVKGNLIDWYGTAYDKTDELARIGKKKIEMAGVNRAIEKHLSELGGRLYDLITVQGHCDNRTTDDSEVLKLVDEIRDLEEQLKVKEDEITSIKGEKEPEDGSGDEPAGKEE